MELSGHRGVVVIGAAKAASTTIAAAIAAHPDVSALSGEYFGFVERTDDAVSITELQDRFACLPQRPRFAFKCAAYMAEPGLPVRLRRALGDVDVVAVLRDPVDRAISGWYWSILCGFAPALDHEVGLRRLLKGEVDPGRWPHAMEVLSWGEYARMLGPWREVYGVERLHIVTEDDVADLPNAVGRLYRNLGLAEARVSPACLRLNEGVYSLARLRWLALRLPLRWHVDTDGIWRMDRPRTFGPRVLDMAITAIDRVALRPFGRRRVEVSPELRLLLTDYYRADQAVLSVLDAQRSRPASLRGHPDLTE